ncbi:hypothetical protein [Embleya sp. AB8]|uniref:hypothetical protein n=1 Tax=Embleya sp. AB8 TaxID=3156304 RepID=UPI003C7880CF
MADGGSKASPARRIAGLHEAAFVSPRRSHLPYTDAVFVALEEDGLVFDRASGMSGGPRAAVAWFGDAEEDEDRYALWTETRGWFLYGFPGPDAAPVRGPFDDLLPGPVEVVTWLRAAVTGRVPAGDAPPGRVTAGPRARCATDPDRWDEEAEAFEERLMAHHERPEDEGGFPLVPVPAPPRNIARAWDRRLRRRCLGCERADGSAPPRGWDRVAALHVGAVAFDADTVATGWCPTCAPSIRSRARHRGGDEALERFALSGAWLVASLRDKFLCPVCRDPWIGDPLALPPLTVGRIQELGLQVHPCPWCWKRNASRSRIAQAAAFRRTW